MALSLLSSEHLPPLPLNNNNFTGEIPSTLANLTNLKCLDLTYNNFGTDVPPQWLDNDHKEVQAFLASLRTNQDVLE